MRGRAGQAARGWRWHGGGRKLRRDPYRGVDASIRLWLLIPWDIGFLLSDCQGYNHTRIQSVQDGQLGADERLRSSS